MLSTPLSLHDHGASVGLTSGIPSISRNPSQPTIPFSFTLPLISGPVLDRVHQGPTGMSTPLIGSFGKPLELSWLSQGSLTPPLQPSLFSINIKNFVTTMLMKVKDFLPWRTQFMAFLVTQWLQGFIDGSIPTPPIYILDNRSIQHLNPSYLVWLHLDKLLR